MSNPTDKTGKQHVSDRGRIRRPACRGDTRADAVSDTLAFWREVASKSAADHPSRVVVRVLEGILRRVGAPR